MTVALLVAVLVLHELGHAAAAWLLGLRQRPFARWGSVGVRVEFPAGGPSAEADLLVALAGPCASIMAAVPLLAVGWNGAAWFSVGLALEHLIPVRVFRVATDGLRARLAVQRLRGAPKGAG